MKCQNFNKTPSYIKYNLNYITHFTFQQKCYRVYARTSLFTLIPYMIAVYSTIIDGLHPTVNSDVFKTSLVV